MNPHPSGKDNAPYICSLLFLNLVIYLLTITVILFNEHSWIIFLNYLDAKGNAPLASVFQILNYIQIPITTLYYTRDGTSY